MPDKSIIRTLDVPSERYSQQAQKSARVVLLIMNLFQKACDPRIAGPYGESHCDDSSTLIAKTHCFGLEVKANRKKTKRAEVERSNARNG